MKHLKSRLPLTLRYADSSKLGTVSVVNKTQNYCKERNARSRNKGAKTRLKSAVLCIKKKNACYYSSMCLPLYVTLVAVCVQGGAQTSHPVPIFAAPQQPIKHAMLGSSGVYLVSTGTEVY